MPTCGPCRLGFIMMLLLNGATALFATSAVVPVAIALQVETESEPDRAASLTVHCGSAFGANPCHATVHGEV